MKMNLPLSPAYTARVNVRPLKERNQNGYGGFGYGGSRLFLAYVEDCFDPPIYAIRADSFEEAYETAEASLAPLVELSDDDLRLLEAGEELAGCNIAADGSVVWTEALQLVQVR